MRQTKCIHDASVSREESRPTRIDRAKSTRWQVPSSQSRAVSLHAHKLGVVTGQHVASQGRILGTLLTFSSSVASFEHRVSGFEANAWHAWFDNVWPWTCSSTDKTREHVEAFLVLHTAQRCSCGRFIPLYTLGHAQYTQHGPWMWVEDHMPFLRHRQMRQIRSATAAASKLGDNREPPRP